MTRERNVNVPHIHRMQPYDGDGFICYVYDTPARPPGMRYMGYGPTPQAAFASWKRGDDLGRDAWDKWVRLGKLMKPEWGFAEPPDKVDIDRIWRELRDGGPAIMQYGYLEQLRKKAPLTYERLRQKRLAAGCTIFAWPPA